ncbi:branched-chain amino acid ABC transporter permease [Pikeienuella sp. HZG-20]|uniref:branched-chain amino acid ABC transporter permease n=1 Tax=Paludibacillus litoralis TaxID=3133267 RepID=UPI0030EE4C3E
MSGGAKAALLHGALLVLLAAAPFLLPDYHSGNLARIMVLAVYAMGYNVLFGYTGLLSLGHALFFAAGMYGLGLTMTHLGAPPAPAFLAGLIAALATSAVIGFLALRTSGVAFMIVTLMFAQAGYLTILLFSDWTQGDEGFVIPQAARQLAGVDLSNGANRYFAALVIFAAAFALLSKLTQAPFGRALVAIRENEERARMLGYDVKRLKLWAIVISGGLSGAAGAAYALLFGYAGASFAAVQYSILPLLWVLLGGAGTLIGPLLGVGLMFYLIDLSSSLTTAHMLIAGAALVLLTLFAPQGLAGELRRRFWGWLP